LTRGLPTTPSRSARALADGVHILWGAIRYDADGAASDAPCRQRQSCRPPCRRLPGDLSDDSSGNVTFEGRHAAPSSWRTCLAGRRPRARRDDRIASVRAGGQAAARSFFPVKAKCAVRSTGLISFLANTAVGRGDHDSLDVAFSMPMARP
jgi:hypothetical protein